MEFIDLKAQYNALGSAVDDRIKAVLTHGQFIMGPEVRELEDRLTSFCGADCITVSSGTEALLIALMALGVGPGDEVITSPFTFAATAEVIALVGATPVFIDVEPDTANMDARLLEGAITDRTRVIMPVSLYGQPADISEINAIADAHGLTVIEDAAQSFGATYQGRRSGALSSIGCTSFFPSKPLGCYGDGGAIFCTNPDLAKVMREIRVHGQERRYYHTRVGLGGRMDTIQCAVVLAKLDRFEWEIDQRISIGDRYLSLLAGLNSIGMPVVRPDRTSVWAQFTIQVEDRDRIAAALKQKGVPTAIHYPIPLHRQPAYSDLCRVVGTLPNSEALSERVLSLPMHPYLDASSQERVVETLGNALR
ncbi:MAG TPA: DegT/DnrJ/EryC1/StrS family aminotransferase [Devosia sp.]|uniref:DegT/DnrJ/EryC1/StrS family aminotransferase n=1 Tax=Devosia sp. TaxID=1871048 RepID=UPI002F93E217